MTYNWNNMVDITVPTGTNGWLYSGEVIINGVKVRFPVGVPTSVPEPAAALLNKMIELEQEDANNTAKPQNHYVGDVTIPAGKTLTLEKGAKFVDNSAPADVVILPETELTALNVIPGEFGQYMLTFAFENIPSAGNTYKVLWGGTEYTSKGVDMSAAMGGQPCVAVGNLAVEGEGGELPESFENPDPTAPYLLVMIPAGVNNTEGAPIQYGMMISQGITPEPPVLSIVQVGGASADSGSDGGVVTATAVIGDGPTVTSISKTYDELLSAVRAGKYVQLKVEIGTAITAVPFVQFLEGYMLFSVVAKNISATIRYYADGKAEWVQ